MWAAALPVGFLELQAHEPLVADEELDAGVFKGGLERFEGCSVRCGGLAAFKLTNGVHGQVRPSGEVFLFPSEQMACRAAQIGRYHTAI